MTDKTYDVIIKSFKQGIIDNKATNRIYDDSVDYYQGAHEIMNLLITPSGALVRRPGSQLLDTANINNIITSRHITFSYQNLDILLILQSQTFYLYKNNKPWCNDSYEQYKLKVDSLFGNDNDQLDYYFDNNQGKLYFFAPNTPVFYIDFSKFISKNLLESVIIEYFDGPYGYINEHDVILTPEQVDGEGIKITASVDDFFYNEEDYPQYYNPYHKFIRIAHDGIWGVAKVVSVVTSSNANQVIVDVIVPFASTASSKVFKVSQFSSYTGYPHHMLIMNNRMYYAKTDFYKDVIWISVLNEYNNFSPTTRKTIDDIVTDIVTYENAIMINIAVGGEILWIKEYGNDLLVGMKNGLFLVTTLKIDEAISPYNIHVIKLSDIAVGSLVTNINDLIIFTHSSLQRLYAIKIMNRQIIYFEHITNNIQHLLYKKHIKKLFAIYAPFPMILIMITDNQLLIASVIVNYDSNYQYAWSQLDFKSYPSKEHIVKVEDVDEVINFVNNTITLESLIPISCYKDDINFYSPQNSYSEIFDLMIGNYNNSSVLYIIIRRVIYFYDAYYDTDKNNDGSYRRVLYITSDSQSQMLAGEFIVLDHKIFNPQNSGKYYIDRPTYHFVKEINSIDDVENSQFISDIGHSCGVINIKDDCNYELRSNHLLLLTNLYNPNYNYNLSVYYYVDESDLIVVEDHNIFEKYVYLGMNYLSYYHSLPLENSNSIFFNKQLIKLTVNLVNTQGVGIGINDANYYRQDLPLMTAFGLNNQVINDNFYNFNICYPTTLRSYYELKITQLLPFTLTVNAIYAVLKFHD